MFHSIQASICILSEKSQIGPSGVRALTLGVAAERSVHYICDYFSFSLSSLCATNFSPRRVYRRVPKFCMGF